MFNEQRARELRERFEVSTGRIIEPHRYKNLNWYLGKNRVNHEDPGDWFNYGDINEEDIAVLGQKLAPGEILILGWKELPPDERFDDFFGNGGGMWLCFTNKGVIYDFRRDGKMMENHG